ncbi:MAG: hypothetical protein IT375_06400 [Polyangiaceae bacterium]|nr:hypothetical protein [Polyangiaceae bacterium]
MHRIKLAWLSAVAVTFAAGACDSGGGGGSGGAAGSAAGGAAGTSTGGVAGTGSGGSVTGGAAGSAPDASSGGSAGSAGTGGGGSGGSSGDAGSDPEAGDAAADAPVSLYCGDGVRDPFSEECDDGNASGADSCDACFVQDVLLVPGPGSDGGVPPKVARRLGEGRHPLAGGDAGFAVAFVTSLPAPVTLGVKRFDSVGVPAGTLSVAADASVTAAAHPVIAALPGGKYAVAYTDLGADGDGLGVALRLVDASGAGPLVRANTTKNFGQHDVDLLWTGSELVAAWVDDSKLPTTGSDLRMRRFSAALSPVSSEEVLAGSAAQESSVALAPFAGSWAAAWRSASAGTEAIVVKTTGASWTVAVASPGPADDKPALAALDASHLLVIFSAGVPARLRGAILDTANQSNVTSFPIAPGVAPYSTDASLAQSHPGVVAAGGRLWVAWRSTAVPGVPEAEELWLKPLDWSSAALDLSQPELPLPRWPSHLSGDQRRPALAASPQPFGVALATAWDDHGRVFGSVEGTPDVVAELMPLPLLRKPVLDGGAQ